jgi:signal transduction histidine kinase/ActR/RegA family two-component response regulator
MNKYQLSILFVGFDEEDAKRIASCFEIGEYQPILECVDREAQVIEVYQSARRDLVLLQDSGNGDSISKNVLSRLADIRHEYSPNCKFIVLEAEFMSFTARPLYQSGADAVVVEGDMQKLAKEYLQQVSKANFTETGKPEDPDGEVNGFTGGSLEQLVQSQRLETIGTLAGGIAHDFNNILAAIMGFAHSALLDVEEESGTASDLNRIIGAAERAASLTSQIMAFGKRRKLNNDLIDFSAVVSEGLEMSRAAIPSNVIFRTELDDNIGDVRADPTQWQQVVLNLCLNSAQAMDDRGGTITIRLRRVSIGAFAGDNQQTNFPAEISPGDYNELSVSDNGVGMSDDVRQRIFEPFFTSRKPGKGTGLGMAVVHGIVSNHQGTISVVSDIGIGSKVLILIPCTALSKKSSEKPGSQKIDSGGREKILFVDDEVDIGLAYAMPLRRLGYDVTVCQSGVEALKLYRADPSQFDLIITDQIMPELSGSELARKVAETGDTTPVMICSGYHTEKISELKDVPNVFEVLRKPVSPNKMGEVIRSIMDKKMPSTKTQTEFRSRH